jgi:hypothetical protein
MIFIENFINKNVLADIRKASAEFWKEYPSSDRFDKLMLCHKTFLERIKTKEPGTAKEIISFLNSWHCRIPKCRAIRLKRILPEVLLLMRKVPQDIEKLEKHHLSIIETFALLRPGLFIMWDNFIAGYYGFANNAAGYCRFLLFFSDFAREIRHSYKRRQPTLEQYLCSEAREWTPTLAKYLDEWNWMMISNKNR